MASGGVLNLDLSHITEGLFTNDVKVAGQNAQGAIGVAQVQAQADIEKSKERNALITKIAIGGGILIAVIATIWLTLRS